MTRRTCDGSAPNRRTVQIASGISALDPCAASTSGPDTVWQILRTAPFSCSSVAERLEWMKMACYSQLVALALQVSLIQYDLIELQKTECVAGSFVG